MRSNYKRLGQFIQQVSVKNINLEVDNLLGVSITKKFIPSIANTIGTDMSKYKVVKKNQFTYGSITSRNGDKISVALLEDDEAIVSTSYTVFEVTKQDELLPEYLMMWFRREEFDRYARYMSHGSTREAFGWDEMCEVELPIPSIEKQREIVKEYHTIVDRIKLNEQLNQKLEETAQEIFNSAFENENDEMKQARLGDFIEIKGGFSYHSDGLFKGSAYLLGMGCISFSSRFIEDGMRLYSNEYPEKHQVKSKDIVIATRQQSENMPILGYPAMIPPYLEKESLIVASNLYKVENNSNLSNEILYQLLRSSSYLEHIKLHTKGTTVGMITKDAVEDFYFNLPSLKSISKLHIELKSIVDLIFIKRNEIKKLIELKEVLLSKMATIEDKK